LQIETPGFACAKAAPHFGHHAEIQSALRKYIARNRSSIDGIEGVNGMVLDVVQRSYHEMRRAQEKA